ncbi:LysM peptidoglycan-binding domain-containing protein [Flavimarina sp. Hel_I_48]|uniref:LysM peptidoglycan-binding domain-containing protein n=1 Tax=Flavimarina sp. Hel_I_48 TaxID=1392488 RepID=UPI0004DF56FA|nr:LysM peptidoglycan-binding domain-containing protein [Flavimarina sp. Hel_I_48]
MKNIAVAFLFIFVICSCASLGQQSYSNHKVSEGETISAIANKYNITVYELYRLNPEARDGLSTGMMLLLPGSKAAMAQKEKESRANEQEFEIHTVEKGETVYSLSKKYGISEATLKRYNEQLYTSELRTGAKIKIPINNGKLTLETQKSTETNRKHVVKPKETIYGLASMYGITIDELKALNPDMANNLPIGTILNVPDKSYTENAKMDESKFAFYKVKQGDTFYSLTKRWSMTDEDLIKLNPALEDGLQQGMILKLPKDGLPIDEQLATSGIQDLSLALTDFSEKHIAILLPFNSNSPADSLKSMLKKNGLSRIALDFYSGALMAVDSAKSLGLSTKLQIYDTQYERGKEMVNAQMINEIIEQDDFSQVDAVIGPLLGQNVTDVSGKLRSKGIPVVSPLTPRLELNSNLFQSRPNDNILKDYMLKYIDVSGKDKNIIVVADGKNQEVKNKILGLYPDAKILDPQSGDNGYYLNPEDILTRLDKNRENWIILETNDIPLISNTITKASTLISEHKVTLMTTSKGDAYDSEDISNMTLMRLGFQFPSIDKQGDLEGELKNFVNKYRKKYGVAPNNYAIRGFDLTLDTLLRLASAEDLYASADSGVETKYIENKFKYIKATKDGFYNQAVYVLKYGPGLILQEIEVPTQIIEKTENFKD